MTDDERQQSGSQGQNNYYGQQQQQQAQSFVFRPTTEFVPSASADEFVPGGYAQYNQQYNQSAQYQTYNAGYNQDYTNTQYQQQQQYYVPNQNQNRGGYQQQFNNTRYNNNYYQQQPQAYVAPQQQQAYVAPQQQQQAYKAPSDPAKSISIRGGPAKSISVGGGGAAVVAAAPAKSISIGGGPVKSISIGGGPAKSISIGGNADMKNDPISKKDATSSPKIPAKTAGTEKKEKATLAVEKKDTVLAEKKEVVVPAEKSEPEAIKLTSVVEKTDEAAAVTAEIAALTVEEEDDAPVELGEAMKEHLNIVFVGHVDAGKSTMGGHILQEAKEAGRESWYLSWALDLNSEERAKGKTVEYGRGYFETDKRRFTILDAPGHKNYVPSMMQGAAQADVGVLVISARKGEFETGFEKGGQTREHAMLCKTVGVKRMILVVNKMDDSTVLWDKTRYDECVGKILPFLKGVGYNLGTDLDVLPISGFTGANIKDHLNKNVCDWYSGPSLLELLDDMNVGDRKIDGPLLMPISDKFKDMGTVITGKIESGKVRKGQNVIIMPNKKVAEVAAIWMEETERNLAISGDNVRIRLKNVEEEDVLSGFVMCSIQKPVHAVTTFEARLAIVEYKSIMCAGYT
ncbi:translation termination factor GTPase eRF3, partial [Physocladia obscura]